MKFDANACSLSALFFVFAGIMFQDITTLLLNPKVFKDTVEIFVDRYKDMGISVVAGKFFRFLGFVSLFAHTYMGVLSIFIYLFMCFSVVDAILILIFIILECIFWVNGQ